MGRGRRIVREKKSGSSVGTAGRRWRQGRWKPIGWYIMGRQRRTSGVGPTQPREEEGNHKPIGWSSLRREGQGNSQWRDAREGRDADGNESAFMAPACPGRRDHHGRGKPPTSKLLTMRHVGPVAVPQWETQEHRNVQEWGGEEETSTGGDRDTRKHGDGL